LEASTAFRQPRFSKFGFAFGMMGKCAFTEFESPESNLHAGAFEGYTGLPALFGA
jgi:hypothetical protein